MSSVTQEVLQLQYDFLKKLLRYEKNELWFIIMLGALKLKQTKI